MLTVYKCIIINMKFTSICTILINITFTLIICTKQKLDLSLNSKFSLLTFNIYTVILANNKTN